MIEMDKIKVLIVDDIQVNRFLLKTICHSMEEVEVLEAEDGAEAVELARCFYPEIILMDIVMPVMDGAEATRRIKEFHPECHVIAVTTVHGAETEERMMGLGASAYLKKPVEKEFVHYKIRNFVNLVKVRKNSESMASKSNALNPFSSNIRNMKTYYNIADGDDMAEFGSWLLDHYLSRNDQASLRFDTILELLFKLMKRALSEGKVLSLVIEEGPDATYVNVPLPFTDPGEEKKLLMEAIGDDVVVRDRFIHLRLEKRGSTDGEGSRAGEVVRMAVSNRPAPAGEPGGEAEPEPLDVPAISPEMEEEFSQLEAEAASLLEEMTPGNAAATMTLLGDCATRYGCLLHQNEAFQTLSYAITSIAMLVQGNRPPSSPAVQESLRSELVDLLELVREWRNAPEAKRRELELALESAEEGLREFYPGV